MKKSLILILLAFFLASCTGSEEDASFQEPSPVEDGETIITPKAVVTSTNGQVAADAGFIEDGGAIAIPTGFTAAQCEFTAALANVSGSTISSRVAVNTTTGVVTCRSVVQQSSQSQPTEASCTASYTIICAQ